MLCLFSLSLTLLADKCHAQYGGPDRKCDCKEGKCKGCSKYFGDGNPCTTYRDVSWRDIFSIRYILYKLELSSSAYLAIILNDLNVLKKRITIIFSAHACI